jgi:hypothetical protein
MRLPNHMHYNDSTPSRAPSGNGAGRPTAFPTQCTPTRVAVPFSAACAWPGASPLSPLPSIPNSGKETQAIQRPIKRDDWLSCIPKGMAWLFKEAIVSFAAYAEANYPGLGACHDPNDAAKVNLVASSGDKFETPHRTHGAPQYSVEQQSFDYRALSGGATGPRKNRLEKLGAIFAEG